MKRSYLPCGSDDAFQSESDKFNASDPIAVASGVQSMCTGRQNFFALVEKSIVVWGPNQFGQCGSLIGLNIQTATGIESYIVQDPTDRQRGLSQGSPYCA